VADLVKNYKNKLNKAKYFFDSNLFEKKGGEIFQKKNENRKFTEKFHH
jgi:hypothetical protein